MVLLCPFLSIFTETLIWNIQIPKVHSQIISGNVCLTIRVDGYRVDVIGVCYSDVLVHAFQVSTKGWCYRWHRLFWEQQQQWYRDESTLVNEGYWQACCLELYCFQSPAWEIYQTPSTTWWFYLAKRGKVSMVSCRSVNTFARLPLVDNKKWAEFCLLHHLILLIFSSISKLFK